ncbi:nuclear transport factor 2 family protein [Fibrella forsythiae]|uniref:Nuclear transport factor 2 family protein n=1 Tax=Fibrella forsythiae TaxID=2817061 RepID=A0ABS3JT25_9BACT|nr:nuclear transport factor 2 family protein [Fibrella forsythiae]MBO0953164.1 nuclear transport factor 2 family protein [Fibrella forsythiae]
MYHRLVEQIVRQNFARLSQGDYESMLKGMAPLITHTFSGQHALGGTRRSVPAMREWFARLFRLFPGLNFEIRRVAVSGWPWLTTIAVEWTDRATPADGSTYVNEGIHLLQMRWGKVVYLRAYLDTAVLAATLEGLAAHGISEALAPPIQD